MSKAHLIESADPIEAGGTLAATCGKEVERVKIAMTWDSLEVGGRAPLSTILFCRKCCEGLQLEGKRYLYAITEGPVSQRSETPNG